MKKLIAMMALGIAAVIPATASAASLPSLDLAVTKNNVVVSGSEVSGPVNVVATVTGEASDVPGLVLLKPGVTAAQFGKLVDSLPSNAPFDAIDPYATVVYDGPTTLKGHPSTVQVDLPAGNYVAINNGNARTPFTVSLASTAATLPAPQATITAIDFAFRGASTIHDGELVRFQNNGFLIHMLGAARLKSAADIKPVLALLGTGKPFPKGAGKPYFATKAFLFAGPLSHNQSEQWVVTQPPGYYIILCAMNAQDGRDHYQLGMYRVLHIIK